MHWAIVNTLYVYVHALYIRDYQCDEQFDEQSDPSTVIEQKYVQ